MYDLSQGRALVLRARCSVHLMDLPAAEADLDAAWALLAPGAGASLLAGNQSALAHWWETTARLRSVRQDFQGAADALATAVEFRRTVSQATQLAGPYKFNSLAVTLRRYGLALLAANDVAGATEAFNESRSIRRQIGLPDFESVPD
jgi:hypothetical protein